MCQAEQNTKYKKEKRGDTNHQSDANEQIIQVENNNNITSGEIPNEIIQ